MRERSIAPGRTGSDRRRHYEIDRSLEQRLEVGEQPEIGIGIASPPAGYRELHEQIEIGGAMRCRGSGAEHVEPATRWRRQSVRHFRQMVGEHLIHDKP